ncbi:complexin-2 [Thomasclavelia spiroformis]|uniref:complexin-2 n=1 Tax=Thomasclavelia spiroformis TaxID=29348 RepID=UPI0024B2074E|nr:complexin-2 [Thomasclavelia spiroformis]
MGKEQVQIPKDVFIKLILLTENLLSNDEVDENEIIQLNNALYKKLDAMIKRDLYTKYKTAPTEEERENSRKKYIEIAKINKKFIW